MGDWNWSHGGVVQPEDAKGAKGDLTVFYVVPVANTRGRLVLISMEMAQNGFKRNVSLYMKGMHYVKPLRLTFTIGIGRHGLISIAIGCSKGTGNASSPALMGLQMTDLEKGWLKMKSEKPMRAGATAGVSSMCASHVQTSDYSDYVKGG